MTLATAAAPPVNGAAPQPYEVAPGLTVGVQRLPALGEAAGAPIYFIAGGPGVSPFEELARRPELFLRLRALGDVVLVEQRGAGSSRPAMDCETRWSLPLDRPPAREEVIADARGQFAACAAALRAAGVDLTAYRTEAYAADLQAVMRSFGHERVRLVAHSYGTMIALELLRRDAGRVERAVLAGVMGPGDALRDPSHHERVLERLAAALGQPGSGLRERTAQALACVQRVPVTVTVDGSAVTLGRDDVARHLVQTAGRPGRARALPAVVDALSLCDGADARATYRPPVADWLHEAARDTRQARRGPLARRAAAQHYLTVCANGEPPERAHARNAPTLFGHQLHAALPAACDAWGLPPAHPRPPVHADTPVLLVSALLDVRTPHEQALAAAATLPNAKLLALAGAGHGEVLEAPGALGEALWARIAAFLRGQRIGDETLDGRYLLSNVANGDQPTK